MAAGTRHHCSPGFPMAHLTAGYQDQEGQDIRKLDTVQVQQQSNPNAPSVLPLSLSVSSSDAHHGETW